MLFESMRNTYPKVFGNHVIGFDSEKNAYTTTPLFQESKTNPGRKFEVGNNISCNFFYYLLGAASEIINLSTLYF